MQVLHIADSLYVTDVLDLAYTLYVAHFLGVLDFVYLLDFLDFGNSPHLAPILHVVEFSYLIDVLPGLSDFRVFIAITARA